MISRRFKQGQAESGRDKLSATKQRIYGVFTIPKAKTPLSANINVMITKTENLQKRFKSVRKVLDTIVNGFCVHSK